MKEKQFCSCCLSIECRNTLSDKCFNGDRKEIYADMLSDTFSINVLNSSYSSSYICEMCITKLRNAAAFKAQVLKAQETLTKGGDSLKDNIDFKIELEDEMNDEKIEIDISPVKDDELNNHSGTCDEETPRLSVQVVAIKLESNQDVVENENIGDVKDIVDMSKTIEATPSSIKEKVTKNGEKSLKRKNVAKAKNAKSVKKVKTTKKISKVKKTTAKKEAIKYERPPITQSEIDARENTLKLIQNSNLCLFRSLRTKFGCFMCKTTFVDAAKLKEHSSTHTNTSFLAFRVRKWRGLSFKSADISDLKCNQCSQNINNLPELINHLKEKHNLPFSGSDHFLVPFRLSKDNQCALCELKFRTFTRLSIHMNSHYTNNVCEICGVPFINRLSLRMHVQSQHREKKCSYCPAKFLTVQAKAKHLKKDHNVFNYKRYCNYCDKTFPYTYLLDKHKIEEHDAKKTVLPCNDCHKTFYTEANLRIHIRSVHIKERNYPCEVCGTRFFTKRDQKRHEKTHNDVRSFCCDYCDTKLKSRDSWRRHMKRQHGHVFP